MNTDNSYKAVRLANCLNVLHQDAAFQYASFSPSVRSIKYAHLAFKLEERVLRRFYEELVAARLPDSDHHLCPTTIFLTLIIICVLLL